MTTFFSIRCDSSKPGINITPGVKGLPFHAVLSFPKTAASIDTPQKRQLNPFNLWLPLNEGNGALGPFLVILLILPGGTSTLKIVIQYL